MSTTCEEHAQKMKAVSHSPELDRHARKCSICHHPDRDAIEEEFLHWHRVIWIAQQYDVPDHRSIYRHARAVGLIQARRENLHSALDNIVEQSDGINASAGDVLRAIRAYSCLSDTGRWSEPPKQVALTYTLSSRGDRVSAGAEGPAVSPGAEPGLPATGPGNANLPIGPSAGEQDSPETSAEFAPSIDDDPTDPSSPNYIEQGPPPADDPEPILIGSPAIRIRPNSLKTKEGLMV